MTMSEVCPRCNASRAICVVRAVLLAFVVFAAGCNEQRATDAARWPGEPTADELDAFVTGAGKLRLRMSEKEVFDALGEPNRRQDETWRPSREFAWDHMAGPHPGAILASFVDGKLVSIMLATATLDLPRIDRAAAESLTRAEVVMRSVAKQLRISDIEAVTGKRGQLVLWTIRQKGGGTLIQNRWAWEIEPGGEALIVDEEDGLAGQPITRELR